MEEKCKFCEIPLYVFKPSDIMPVKLVAKFCPVCGKERDVRENQSHIPPYSTWTEYFNDLMKYGPSCVGGSYGSK